MLTHRSFQAHPAVRFSLLALGSIAGHTDPVRWASIHIQHHAHSDTDGDPHSPRDSLFHAHFGWIYDGINPQPEIYGKWLLKDTMALFFQRTFRSRFALVANRSVGLRDYDLRVAGVGLACAAHLPGGSSGAAGEAPPGRVGSNGPSSAWHGASRACTPQWFAATKRDTMKNPIGLRLLFLFVVVQAVPLAQRHAALFGIIFGALIALCAF